MGKAALIWKAFTTEGCEIKYAKCMFCNKLVSRGSEDPRKQTTSNMKNHMTKEHKDDWNNLELQDLENKAKDSFS